MMCECQKTLYGNMSHSTVQEALRIPGLQGVRGSSGH